MCVLCFYIFSYAAGIFSMSHEECEINQITFVYENLAALKIYLNYFLKKTTKTFHLINHTTLDKITWKSLSMAFNYRGMLRLHTWLISTMMTWKIASLEHESGE